jgi:hypothetical protein
VQEDQRDPGSAHHGACDRSRPACAQDVIVGLDRDSHVWKRH